MAILYKEQKILLLSLSGVRIKNPDLRKLGVSLPGFVKRGQVIASLPNLALLTLASYTPNHWDLTYKELDEITDSELSGIINENFDLVFISCLTARIYDAYRVSDYLRNNGCKVVMGGLHVSMLPKEALHYCDSVVIGEGEQVWGNILKDFEDNCLKETYTGKLGSFQDVKIPAYHLLNPEQYHRITLQTTRGCPLDCGFCASSRLISNYKVKPISKIRQELETILNYWEKPFVELADDNTFVNKKWAKELATALSDYQIKWFTETDISVADDETLLELLSQSNCTQLLIGFESINKRSLYPVDSKHWKFNQLENYIEKIKKIQSYGIAVIGCFVLGLDQDDTNVFDETSSFILESGLADVQLTILTPFPGTALYKSLKQQGRLLKEKFWDECTLFDVTFQPKNMTNVELENGFMALMEKTYNKTRTKERYQLLKSCIREKRRMQLSRRQFS